MPDPSPTSPPPISLQGYLLIALESLSDPNFSRTVVLIVQHDAQGALGLVLNRPTNATIAQAWQQVSEVPCGLEAFLFQGGPCEGPLMVLHAQSQLSQIQVLPELHFATESHTIQALVETQANPIKFFVGYAGWTAGQLEDELLAGGWALLPATAEIPFAQTDNLWLTLSRKASRSRSAPNIPPHLLPPDPSVN